MQTGAAGASPVRAQPADRGKQDVGPAGRAPAGGSGGGAAVSGELWANCVGLCLRNRWVHLWGEHVQAMSPAYMTRTRWHGVLQYHPQNCRAALGTAVGDRQICAWQCLYHSSDKPPIKLVHGCQAAPVSLGCNKDMDVQHLHAHTWLARSMTDHTHTPSATVLP